MSIKRSSGMLGLDQTAIKNINWNLAVKRILNDVKSDFIYAPHLRFIYSKAASALIEQAKRELNSGTFAVGTPLTIDVPKSNRVRISNSKRLGPNFTRPGSILLPFDRLIYQALGDKAAPLVERSLDRSRSFSHVLADSNSESMFLPARNCWSSLQQALAKNASIKTVAYVVKIDVANYFGSINQHTLINILNDSQFDSALASRLEEILIDFTGDRSSRGIIQGLYTSDLLGNFYMMPIDRFIQEYGAPSARYVDDIYIFVDGYDDAYQFIQLLIQTLRSYDLILNEAKTYILSKHLLVTEEPDLEKLFADAVKEISSQGDDEDDSSDGYGFQMDWEDNDFEDEDDREEEAHDEDEDEELIDTHEYELLATQILFDSMSTYPGHEESIERFCIPIFQKMKSDYALENVKVFFDDRPSMTQIYCSYFATFIARNDVIEFLSDEIGNINHSDWQLMWIIASLLQAEDVSQETIRIAYSLILDANRHDGLRAVAAIFVGKYGDFARRRNLIATYSSLNEYIRSAVYFSSMYWPGVERRNAKSSWGSQGSLNRLITVGFEKK